jgi:hypothetical protein
MGGGSRWVVCVLLCVVVPPTGDQFPCRLLSRIGKETNVNDFLTEFKLEKMVILDGKGRKERTAKTRANLSE